MSCRLNFFRFPEILTWRENPNEARILKRGNARVQEKVVNCTLALALF